MDNLDKNEEVTLTAAEKLAQFEKQKLSRRQALARIGFQAGAAAIAALTADDLLRAVGKEMKRRAGDNKVAQQVGKELEQAGIAKADGIPLCCIVYDSSTLTCYNKCQNRYDVCASGCPAGSAGDACRAACGISRANCQNDNCSCCINE